MPDLQSCYFCSTPENVQEYAVVPQRFTPDDESPQSAVLCDQCKTKLLEVIEPLTEQLAEGPGSSGENAVPSTGGAGSPPTDESPEPDVSMSSPADVGTDAAPDSTGNEEDESAGANAGESSTPPNYRRAMRMLSNREFPLPRSEVESMLAGAYDLERHEIASVLDHAIETGRLVEEDGQFDEP